MATEIRIGRIVRIEGISILIQVTDDVSDKLLIYKEHSDFLVSINRLAFSKLPSGKLVIVKIIRIYDKTAFDREDVFQDAKGKYMIEARLSGIFDLFLDTFDSGINTFPIIGSEVFALGSELYSRVLRLDSPFSIEIGSAYNDSSISVCADPDTLLGKHLSVIGNTGTGKTCTVASIIQGLRTRLKPPTRLSPKIVIFDSNMEYERAFPGHLYKTKTISKESLSIPHHYLDIHEYYKLLDASQGVQAPILKQAIAELKGNNGSFDFNDLPDQIDHLVQLKSGYNAANKSTHFSYNQWSGWLAPMVNRIHALIDDPRFAPVIQKTETNLHELLEGPEEVLIMDIDFSRDVLDVVMFLFCKLVYNWAQSRTSKRNVVLVFEEAHRYINESELNEYKLGNYYIERLAREGRKFGISLIISSQRPSELSRTVLSQCNSHVIHRVTNRADLDFVNRLLPFDNKELIDLLPGLEKQYAIVCGEAFAYSELIKVAIAEPTPKSDDPEVINSWKMPVRKKSPRKRSEG